jgi:alpha-L-fucosidase
MDFMTLTRRSFVTGSLSALAYLSLHAEDASAPKPYGALPSARQLQWHQMETYSFLHFTVNTFTNKEWGYGDEDPSVFNPAQFDADAIVAALKAGGMKGVILTCKHHDGFCLWPTKTTEHCIRNSHWKNGKGDVVREISEAAHRHGLKFGVYVSPWDRNNPNYGKPAYLPIYRQQITELLSNYGPIFEIWFDGANGGDGYYGGARETRTIDKHNYYDWPTTHKIVRDLQPNAVIFGDAGPDIRWVGNEKGIAGETCWATYNPIGHNGAPAVPGDVLEDQSTTGTRNGKQWMPAECDVSVRPGWFWHEDQNSQVKTPQQLMDLYFQSTGRGASLLLNVPPNKLGLLSPEDVASLKGFHQHMQDTFETNLAAGAKLRATNVRGKSIAYGPQNLFNDNRESYWATDDAITTPELVIDLPRPGAFNIIRLREAIQLGQRIGSFAVDTWQHGAWTQIAQGTSIGSCRVVLLDKPIEATRLRLRITESEACIALAELGIHLYKT